MNDGAAFQYWTARFQEAALDPGRWLPTLQDLADAAGSSRAELVGFGGLGFTPFNWITSATERMLVDFHRVDGDSPKANYRLAADDGTSVMKLVDERTYDVTRRQMVHHDYIDFCEDHQIVFGCQTVLHRSDNGLIGMSILRSRADGRTDQAAQETLRHAASGARVALHMQRVIEEQGAQLLAGALGAMSLPCLLLDGFGKVRALTEPADKLLCSEPGLLLVEGSLRSRHPPSDRRIQLALAAVLGKESAPHMSVALGEPQRSSLVIDIFRLPQREWTMNFAPRAIIVLKDGRQNIRASAQILAATYGLTPAETEVSLALCKGTPRRQIAAERNVSMETLRTQIRNLYSKTGCGREAELVVLFKALLA